MNSEKRNISREYIRNLEYEKKSIIYDKIYTLNEEKIIRLFSEYNDGLFMNYKTIYEIIYKNLDDISNKIEIKKNDINKIKEVLITLRNIIYMIYMWNYVNYI